MSANMLRQMLAEAAAFLKDERFEQALDASRRVTQLDAGSFQGFMCVGLASQQLQQWDGAEQAFRRAAGLKPELPAPWKGLADLFTARDQPEKKLEALEKLVDIFHKNQKIKACQKWIADIASTALELKRLPLAFDAWYSLVGRPNGSNRDDVRLANTSNAELPSPFSIWLDLVDLLQRPGFSLEDCSDVHNIDELSEEFFVVASNAIEAASEQDCGRVDACIAYFMRHYLDRLQQAKSKKSAKLAKIDTLAISILKWSPTAKLAAEFVLLRSEDENSPVTFEEAQQIASALSAAHPRSPMAIAFEGIKAFTQQDFATARAFFIDALSSVTTSSFQEAVFCIQAQIALAKIALHMRDVEGCLNRLQLAKQTIEDKQTRLGCGSPSSSVYTEVEALMLEGTAREYAGAFDQALEAYKSVISSGDASNSINAAVAGAELLIQQNHLDDALELLDRCPESGDDAKEALLDSTRGWIFFKQGKPADAKEVLQSASIKILPSQATYKGRVSKRLAVVYWHLGNSFRSEKSYCFNHLLQAAKLVPSDAETFAWLGKWYKEIAADVIRAEKCFLKALSLSPRNELAGTELSDVYTKQDKHELNVKLWEDVTSEQEHAPTWALLRLAQHLVNVDDERAVGKLHLALRNNPLSATLWVALAHVYSHFGKHVSAHKSYLKAMELGEDGWCIRLELARIEGGLHLFEDALCRIVPVIEALETGNTSNGVDQAAVSMAYADLLFREAKSLCADGLYGRAAANLIRASKVLKELPATSAVASSPEALKLIGDLHSFAFYLAPSDFNDDNGLSWVKFISEGRRAYKAAAAIIDKRDVGQNDQFKQTQTSELLYDVGLSCWYEALATANANNVAIDAFSSEVSGENTSPSTSKVATLRQEAVASFRVALQRDPSSAVAWNGLAVAHTNVLVKQFAWTRAIQASNHEAAWANLGMFYLRSCDALPSLASKLAQRSFLQLQSVNPDNPAMWNGYAMLARRHTASAEQREKAVEAFSCALKNGLDLDALLGLVLLLQEKQNGDQTTKSDAGHSDEEILFYMRKYIERDPFHPAAWNALGVVQQRLGLYERAGHAFARALTLCAAETSTARVGSGIEWNALVASVGASATIDEQKIKRLIAAVGSNPRESSTAHAHAAALTMILQAQLHAASGNWKKSFEALSQMVRLQHDSLAASVASGLGVVGLSLLAVTNKANGAGLPNLSSSFTDAIKNYSGSSPELQVDRSVIEGYERLYGTYGSFFDANSQGDNGAIPVRTGLAMVDLNLTKVKMADIERSLSSVIYQSFETDDAYDVTTLGVLVSLQSANAKQSVSAGMKLVRIQPQNPYSYVMAGIGLLKRIRYENDTEVRNTLLTQLERLLHIGRQHASKAEPGFDRVQIELLLGHCNAALGKDDLAAKHAAQGLEHLDLIESSTSKMLQIQNALLRTRLLAIKDPAKAALSYHGVVETLAEMSEAGSSDSAAFATAALKVTLMHLGGYYEELGQLEGAMQVWKALANGSLSSQSTSTIGVTGVEVSDASAGYIANLRLALAHAKKGNSKMTKKQIKTALTLLGDESVAASPAATVAGFIENVVA